MTDLVPAPAEAAAAHPARRRAIVLLAAVVTTGVTARLGVWQLDRARQKTELGQLLARRGREPVVPLAGLAREPDAALLQHQRLTVLQGRWLHAHTVFLDNRAMDGRAGFYVLTPLLLAPGDAVLVQRGWVPRDAADRRRLPPVPAPDGEVTVHGRIAPPPSALLELGAGEGGPIRQNLALPAFAREIGVALRPLSVQELDTTATAATSPAVLLRHWPQPALDVGKHHGYAFQWFALSALTVGLTAWFQFIQPRRRARTRPR